MSGWWWAPKTRRWASRAGLGRHVVEQQLFLETVTNVVSSGKFMRIRTFYYLPPKAGFNWRGPARR